MKEPIMTDIKKFTRNFALYSFSNGVGSVIDLYGSEFHINQHRFSPDADYEALVRDREELIKDIQKALERLQQTTIQQTMEEDPVRAEVVVQVLERVRANSEKARNLSFYPINAARRASRMRKQKEQFNRWRRMVKKQTHAANTPELTANI